MMRKPYKLNDELIYKIAQLIQLAMLTGTNVVDHMRQLRVEESSEFPESLVLTPEYKEYFDKVLQVMLDEVNEIKESQQKTILQ